MNLILLVGTNPLPDFVTALALQQDVKKVFLVHSQDNRNQKGTDKVAGWLRERLLRRSFPGNAIKLIPLTNVSSAEEIHNNLETLLLPQMLLDRPVHLNYTGGTKAMAVHVHAWLTEKATKGVVTEAVFSYLNARSSKLEYDYEKREASSDLRTLVHIGRIDELLNIHGYNPVQTRVEYFPDALAKLKELIENDQIEAFLEWKRAIRPIFIQGDTIVNTNTLQMNIAQKKGAVKYFCSSLDALAFIRPLLNAFPAENSLLDSDGDLWFMNKTITRNEIERRINKPFVEFLDGKWLEQHVFEVIQELAQEYGLSNEQYGISLKAIKQGTNQTFELDNFIIKGYQLIGISITTGKKDKSKSKAFEVMHRVQQVGGDESKALVIGMLSAEEVKIIQTDIPYLMTGTNEDHFKVIGTSCWKRSALKEELRRFIWP
jgi:hypothetical protein